jgi:hypothetical protein
MVRSTRRAAFFGSPFSAPVPGGSKNLAYAPAGSDYLAMATSTFNRAVAALWSKFNHLRLADFLTGNSSLVLRASSGDFFGAGQPYRPDWCRS